MPKTSKKHSQIAPKTPPKTPKNESPEGSGGGLEEETVFCTFIYRFGDGFGLHFGAQVAPKSD